AVTGAGKSILIAEIVWVHGGRVVITTPTVKLVDQIAATLKQRGIKTGKYYTKGKQSSRDVIVCCNDSLQSLSERIDPPDLWIADEAHKTECDQIKDVVLGPKDHEGRRIADAAWVPGKRIGFTATPYRADREERLSLFDQMAYNYGPAEAMKDGVVVPPRVVHYTGKARELDEACVEMIKGASGPGIVDAINISDAEKFAELLRERGLRSKAVHSKLHEATVDKRVKQLKDGELDCLVHVSLLSEGVDFPWLRWLCCRRPISSRVLFAQYIGRGLRTFPNKTHCVVYDPQDLFGTLSLDYEAILSGGIDEEEAIPKLPALELDWIVDEIRESSEPQETLAGVPVKVINPTVSYIRRMRLSFQAMGLCSMHIGDAEWRRETPTTHQLGKISKLAWTALEHDVPPEQSRALRIAIRAIKACDRGTASDLISILSVLRYGWPAGAGEVAA
ncbi:MAG: DEAD/DEAH box helicase, partial [Bradymonadaceae bacterium]